MTRTLDTDRFTLNDLHLAGVYWPILMAQARRSQKAGGAPLLLKYGDLVKIAKAAHPADVVVQGAIPTSVGRKLDPINWFCRDQGLPNLTCQAVNADGKPGLGYLRSANWQDELAEVARYDWSSCEVSFGVYISTTRSARTAAGLKGRSRMSEKNAAQALFDWWLPGKTRLPRPTEDQKAAIVELVRDWIQPSEAFAAVMGAELD
jgi:hypothetical protein